jgi:PP-loop superfamily ATP-utilizing enzyme
MSRALHELGFRYVALDLDGYRTGALNEVLQVELPSGKDARSHRRS